jgi:hypothetical protein
MRKTPATFSVHQHGDLQHNLTSENTADPLMNELPYVFSEIMDETWWF